MEFKVLDRYRLELHWTKVKYDVDQMALLEGCYFSGPVLKDVAQLNQIDSMDLDFAGQYMVFVNFYYIAKLTWQGASHSQSKIFLKDAKLKNKNLNVVPKLNHNDYIVIDTQSHENEKHNYSLVYPSFLMCKDHQFYDFRSMQ